MRLMDSITRALTPKPRMAKPRDPAQDRHVLWHTSETDKVKYTSATRILWIQNILSNPAAYAGMERDFNLIPHPSQTADEFDDAADLVLGVASGGIGKVCLIVPRKRSYRPLIGGANGFAFYLIEDLCHEVKMSGRDLSESCYIARYPGQSAKGREDMRAALAEAHAEYAKRNPPPASRRDPRPGQWFDPGPRQREYVQ